MSTRCFFSLILDRAKMLELTRKSFKMQKEIGAEICEGGSLGISCTGSDCTVYIDRGGCGDKEVAGMFHTHTGTYGKRWQPKLSAADIGNGIYHGYSMLCLGAKVSGKFQVECLCADKRELDEARKKYRETRDTENLIAFTRFIAEQGKLYGRRC